MSSHESLLLVRMMRYQGLVGDRDLERVICLAEESKDHRDLLRTLVEEGLADQEWASKIEEYVVTRSRCRSSETDTLFRLDRSFGQIGLGRGWIQLADLEGALLEQERLRRKNLHFRVGEILVGQGAITVEQVRQILREQGCATLRCDSCGTIVSVVERQSTTCECSGTLVPPVFLELVKVDS